VASLLLLIPVTADAAVRPPLEAAGR